MTPEQLVGRDRMGYEDPMSSCLALTFLPLAHSLIQSLTNTHTSDLFKTSTTSLSVPVSTFAPWEAFEMA